MTKCANAQRRDYKVSSAALEDILTDATVEIDALNHAIGNGDTCTDSAALTVYRNAFEALHRGAITLIADAVSVEIERNIARMKDYDSALESAPRFPL